MNQPLQQRKLEITSNLPNFLSIEFNVILSRDGIDEHGNDLKARHYNNFEVPVKKLAKTKRKLSSLRGKVSKMSAEEIDKQLNSLRNEWQRDI
jgi:ribosomal protein L29